MSEYSFDERLRMSNGVTATSNLEEILCIVIPGAIEVVRASKSEDRSGIDYWVRRDCGRDLAVDVKNRETDFKKKGNDDLALEIWSDKKARTVGWTCDKNKKTDYILWFWQDTRRWALVPFVLLCAVFNAHLDKWSRLYKHGHQTSHKNGHSWQSECVFVPRHEVWAAIYRRFGGIHANIQAEPPTPGIQIDLFGNGQP